MNTELRKKLADTQDTESERERKQEVLENEIDTANNIVKGFKNAREESKK